MDWPLRDKSPEASQMAPLLASLRHQSTPKKTQPHKRQPSHEDIILSEISEFSDSLRNTLVPKYDAVETQLNDSMAGVSQKLEQLTDIHRQMQEMVESFKTEMETTKGDVNEHMQKIDTWQAKERNVEEMHLRVERAKSRLEEYKLRLESLDKNTQSTEALATTRGNQIRFASRAVFALLAVLLAVGYWQLQQF